MILVDSSVWIDYFNGVSSWQTDYLDKGLGQQEIIVGDIILTEVLQGFKSDWDYELALGLLEKFPIRNMIGKQMAINSALNYRKLRKKGITIRKTIDMIIGTYCIDNGLKLLHSDKDFDVLVTHLGLVAVVE
jgi:predicted nucleic acid-binding protein